MPNKQLTETQIALLKKPLPDQAVSKHPTKPYLSSIKAIYVVERLNDVFGTGSWHLKSEVINDKTDMIVVKAVLTIPEYGVELESYGGNDNGGEASKNHDLGDAYKGAVTDALTKICSYLGIAMDVYKGQRSGGASSQPQGSNNTTQGDDKPWLNENTTAFTGAIEKLKKGATTIDKIKLAFKVSKAIEDKLKSALPVNSN